MSLRLTPTTELNAVNEMLTAIGVTPIETLGVPGLTDASIAHDTLSGVSREVQSQGWNFNQSYNVTINLSAAWNVPDNILSMRPARNGFGSGETRRFVLRNNQLFDLNTNAYITLGSVRADVIYLFDFEELPETVRRYITIRAARIFQTKVLGDDQLGVFTEAHENEAWDILEADDANNETHSRLFQKAASRRIAQLRKDPTLNSRQGRQQGNG